MVLFLNQVTSASGTPRKKKKKKQHISETDSGDPGGGYSRLVDPPRGNSAGSICLGVFYRPPAKLNNACDLSVVSRALAF